jgi:hypothetical protein
VPVPDADPAAKDLDAAFAAAMEGPARPRSEAKAPPEIDPEAPFGRDEHGEPIAKYGRTKDGKIKRSAGGRPPKDDPNRPRVGPAPPSQPDAPAAASGGRDYTEGLAGAADGAWLVLSTASKLPLKTVPVLGQFLPDPQKIAAQAYLLSRSKGSLVVALNEAAKHNARANALAAKLSEGDATWVLTVASLAGPFVGASLALWRGDEQLDVAAMAKANEAQLDQVMTALNEQAEQIQAQAALAAETAQQSPNGAHPEPAMAG